MHKILSCTAPEEVNISQNHIFALFQNHTLLILNDWFRNYGDKYSNKKYVHLIKVC